MRFVTSRYFVRIRETDDDATSTVQNGLDFTLDESRFYYRIYKRTGYFKPFR